MSAGRGFFVESARIAACLGECEDRRKADSCTVMCTERATSARPGRIVGCLRPDRYGPGVAIPAAVKDVAVSQVATYCATKIPSEHADEIRIEYKVRGNAITLYERRPPWREGLGPEWSSMRICVFEWDPETELWTLFARDRNDRRLDYPFVEPAADLMPLLLEVESDPTCIFWG
jgi:hypothetical protein